MNTTDTLEKLKQHQRSEFVKKAIENGFTEQQSAFLYDEIFSQIAMKAMFGGLF